ncbi:TetR/AcrR family transcriptional regulator [Curtobacterium sp. RRHDQ66]|uniref:TetR/AcrR family transcriptional regulator n=1 Tax=Curtobacterium guangdongense TaxID=3413380 RepID=UPI003BEFE72D
MPRTATRGGPKTREKIASTAAELFLEHGFDAVTVAQVARAAGVSSVTVFNHFPRKEDLFLDRSDEARDLLVGAVAGRPDGLGVGESLSALFHRLADEHHPLSGLDPRSVPFFRTIAGSPALLAHARAIATELQAALRDALSSDDSFAADAGLAAAYVVAGYGSVLVETAGRVLAGESGDDVAAAHHARVDRLVDTLRHGVLPA